MYTAEELTDIEDFEGCARFIVFCLLISGIVFICPRLDKHFKDSNTEKQQLCIDLCPNNAIPTDKLYIGE